MRHSKRLLVAVALGSVLWVAGCGKSEPTTKLGPPDESVLMKSKNPRKPQPPLPPEPEVPNQPTTKNKK
jgi:hypothetical protein